ncbi:hypothetical protein VTN00DRAFT_2289 [Thermoascus crustaceus]|uniref:uncharacterized protein n=1 Tax=Thermoascus crustaceus TaxID=5088 RepID=UPI003743F64B
MFNLDVLLSLRAIIDYEFQQHLLQHPLYMNTHGYYLHAYTITSFCLLHGIETHGWDSTTSFVLGIGVFFGGWVETKLLYIYQPTYLSRRIHRLRIQDNTDKTVKRVML